MVGAERSIARKTFIMRYPPMWSKGIPRTCLSHIISHIQDFGKGKLHMNSFLVLLEVVASISRLILARALLKYVNATDKENEE